MHTWGWSLTLPMLLASFLVLISAVKEKCQHHYIWAYMYMFLHLNWQHNYWDCTATSLLKAVGSDSSVVLLASYCAPRGSTYIAEVMSNEPSAFAIHCCLIVITQGVDLWGCSAMTDKETALHQLQSYFESSSISLFPLCCCTLTTLQHDSYNIFNCTNIQFVLCWWLRCMTKGPMLRF